MRALISVLARVLVRTPVLRGAFVYLIGLFLVLFSGIVVSTEVTWSSEQMMDQLGGAIGLTMLAAGLVAFACYLLHRDGVKRLILGVLAGIVGLVYAGALLYGFVFMPMQDYNNALSIMQRGQYEWASQRFASLGDYKDSEAMMEECERHIAYQKAKEAFDEGKDAAAYEGFRGLKGFLDVDEILATERMHAAREKKYAVGSSFEMGSYAIRKSDVDGEKSPITWEILAREGDRALIISYYALEKRPYHDNAGPVTWEQCTLRQWLNGEFLSAAFTAKEQSTILLTQVDNGPDQHKAGAVDGGRDTEDRVFLLSYAQAWSYYTDNRWRIANRTPILRGDKDNPDECIWLLRSPGHYEGMSAAVHTSGNYLSQEVADTSIFGGYVRPAMWVFLDPEIF